MKKRFLFIISILLSLVAKSQTLVAIPDESFRNKLKERCPNCFVGDSMDTKMAADSITGYLGIEAQSINSIDGLQYLLGITSLYCKQNNLSSLPVLPNGLEFMDCSENNINELPELPASLVGLSCQKNPIISLPALPTSLEGLNCSNTNIFVLPNLPSRLRSLSVEKTNITSLAILPETLEYLFIGENNFLTFPYLSSSLIFLDCHGNNLNSLPPLPVGLNILRCNDNPNLATLPQLPDLMNELDIYGTGIKCVPNKPEGLLDFLTDSRIYLCGSKEDSLSRILVEVPDSNFRNILKGRCPECFEGDLMHPALAEENIRGELHIGETLYFNISLDEYKIRSVEGLQYLSRVTSFICKAGYLTTLPTLPKGLLHLDVNENPIIEFPELPSTLVELTFGRFIGSNFPSVPITTLPSLPSSLKDLRIWGTQLDSLPELPNGLKTLIVGSSKLTTLPTLPDSIEYLNCTQNNLLVLPNLPSGLQFLNFAENFNLTSLPSLPNGLVGLNIGYTDIKTLAVLPDSLRSLICNSSSIQTLPFLPSGIIELNCNNSPDLYCLPYLPNSLTSLQIYGSGINCIPNKPELLYLDPEIPLCNTTNNKSNCYSYPRIVGRVFIDENKNGLKDETEPIKRDVKVTVMPSGNFAFTNEKGEYELGVDSLKDYTISIEVPPYFANSNNNQTFTTTYFGEEIKKDFALIPLKNVKELSAILTPTSLARPGFGLSFLLEIENKGTTIENGSAYIDMPSMYTLDSTSITSTNGQFNFQNLHPGECIKMMVYGKVSTAAPLGDSLKFKGIVNIYDQGTDSVYSNNISAVAMLIRGSYDPNDKQGPKSVTPKQVQKGDFVEYTIRFQNTGTDTAFTVVVADTLTQNLISNTLEMVSASHVCKTTVIDDKVYFEFKNILLVDSNTNEPMSHGFVRFKVKAINALSLGQTIQNTASIYFDYNNPVVTNTVTTKVSDPIITSTEVNLIQSNIGSMAYPNPAEGDYLYVRDFMGSTYTLSDTQGHALMKGNVSESGINVSQLKPGVYMLETTQNQSRKVEKVVVK